MRARSLVAGLSASLLLIGVGCVEAPEPVAPKLVVMISVDQLRGDLLDRFGPAFTGGFRTLMDEGLWYDQASHNHASTSTGIGHTTLSTGVTPTRHGIVGNSWREVEPDGSLRSVYAVEDRAAPLIGFPNATGRSPANIFRTGLADWMQEADPRTQVLSVSSKDRGAIPMAGQSRGHVYWLVPEAGRFATSTYYRDSYPEWVERFNRERMPEIMGDSVWEYSVDPRFDDLARADEAPYEGDSRHTTFPHERARGRPSFSPGAQYAWAARTPASDEATLRLALEGMSRLQLGQGEATDFLALSFSATDYVGHGYGPLSREQLDNLVRLDGLLAELFQALDAQVGAGNWVVGLSADHGVITMPEYLAETGEPGYRTTTDDLDDIPRLADSVQAEMEDAPAEEIEAAIATRLEALEWVADVMTAAELRAPSTDSMVDLFVKSWNADRRWGELPARGMYVRATEGTYASSYPTGTGHGSAYWYDRWVPIVFLGGGLPAERRSEGVYTYDLAPTLAALAGVEPPTDLDGRALILP